MNGRLVFAAGAGVAVGMAFAGAAWADGYSVPVEEPAPAADLCFDKGLNDYVPCEAPPFVGPWTGYYVGLHGGFAAVDWSGAFEDDFDWSDLNESGFVIGGQIGYNHQLPNNLVLGVEGDFSYGLGLDATAIELDTPDPNEFIDSDIDWLASLRLKAGLAVGDFMPFVTGGVGFARYDLDYTLEGAPADSFNTTGVSVGPVVGGGLEYMVAPNLTVRGEALYYYFDDTIGGRFSGSNLVLEDILVGRLAVNLKF